MGVTRQGEDAGCQARHAWSLRAPRQVMTAAGRDNGCRTRPNGSLVLRLAIAAGSLALVSLLLTGAPAVAHADASASFGGDIQALEAANSIDRAGILRAWDVKRGVLEECPTRGQLAILIARAIGLAGSSTPHFDDVSPPMPCAGAVGALYEAGLVTGKTPTTFGPGELISRQQAVRWIVDALGYQVANDHSGALLPRLPYPVSTDVWLGAFQDRPLINSDCIQDVANAYRLGIIDATVDACFYPNLPLSWGDMVVLLDRAFVRRSAVRDTYPIAVGPISNYPELTTNSSGVRVWHLEYQLTALKYCPGTIDGIYDNRTRDAVMAFQKAEGLKRTGVATDAMLQQLAVAVAPTPRVADVGTRVEVDLTRQLLLMVTDNRVRKVVPVSTGRSGTRIGHFSIRSKYPGWVRCITLSGVMYYPSYVVSRTAIHGYKSVPSYPASHGCVRVPVWMAEELFYEMPIGTTVDIYR